MNQFSLAEILIHDCKGRAGNGAVQPHSLREAAHQRRLPGTELAVQAENRRLPDQSRKGSAKSFRLLLAVSNHFSHNNSLSVILLFVTVYHLSEDLSNRIEPAVKIRSRDPRFLHSRFGLSVRRTEAGSTPDLFN